MDSDDSEYSDMDELVSQAMISVKKCMKSLKKQPKDDAQIDSESEHDHSEQVDEISLPVPAQSTSSTEREMKKKAESSIDTQQFRVEPLPPHQSWRQRKKQYKREKATTKGKNWFNMKAEEMTDEKKNDLMVLQMRQALDRKAFYKGNDRKVLPKFFQVGTWVDTPQDFHHRVPKKQRKRTIVDELLADVEFRKYNKKKYAEIMEEKRRGTGPYKKQKFVKRLKKKFK